MGEPPMFCIGRNVHDYIFTKLVSFTKFVKISSLENFQISAYSYTVVCTVVVICNGSPCLIINICNGTVDVV